MKVAIQTMVKDFNAAVSVSPVEGLHPCLQWMPHREVVLKSMLMQLSIIQQGLLRWEWWLRMKNLKSAT